MPERETRGGAVADVTLLRGRRAIEDRAVPQRAQQLDVLGVRPGQRARGVRGTSEKKAALRDVRRVPNLFGDQTAFTRKRFQRAAQAARFLAMPGVQCIVRALAGEQRPGAADSRWNIFLKKLLRHHWSW